MPLPLGHTAIGLAAYELDSDNNSATSRLKLIIFISVLANLPDLDVIIGLVVKWNGSAFHRGPTHSVIFALIMGFFASRAWKFSSQIPRMKFGMCFLIILSHILGDIFFTPSPVSFFWPFEVSWSSGYNGWSDVLSLVFVQEFQDIGVIVGSALLIMFARLIRRHNRRGLAFHKDGF
jgi:membrane-bound metal-dependent hydrolase YbcI (DUF457 family)